MNAGGAPGQNGGQGQSQVAHDHKHFQDTNRYYSTKTCEQLDWSKEMSWPEVYGIALQLAQGREDEDVYRP